MYDPKYENLKNISTELENFSTEVRIRCHHAIYAVHLACKKFALVLSHSSTWDLYEDTNYMYTAHTFDNYWKLTEKLLLAVKIIKRHAVDFTDGHLTYGTNFSCFLADVLG